MEQIRSESNSLFKVNQIICLEHEETYLYGEVIQLIPIRRMCWFRPICMTKSNFDRNGNLENSFLIHLRSGSDLLWPISLFRPALDTEVISLLTDLDDSDKSEQAARFDRQHLNQFVRQVWEANQDKF